MSDDAADRRMGRDHHHHLAVRDSARSGAMGVQVSAPFTGAPGSDRITGGTDPATRAPVIVSRLPVGSSAKMTFLFTRARAMRLVVFVRLRG